MARAADPALVDYVRKNPKEARDRAARLRKSRIWKARHDSNAFMEFVLRDELTDDPIVQAPHHVAWQDLATAHKRLVIWSHVEAGKSFQFSVGRTLFELGRNHSLRLAIISATAGQAEKFLDLIKTYIEHSVELREVFADDPLEPGDEWTGSSIKVKRKTRAKDPSIQAIGYDGKLVGARIDGMILDDILDYENTRTEHQRDEVWAKMQSSGIMGRLTEDAFLWVIGTARRSTRPTRSTASRICGPRRRTSTRSSTPTRAS
jgi:hypothetical protein